MARNDCYSNSLYQINKYRTNTKQNTKRPTFRTSKVGRGFFGPAITEGLRRGKPAGLRALGTERSYISSIFPFPPGLTTAVKWRKLGWSDCSPEALLPVSDSQRLRAGLAHLPNYDVQEGRTLGRRGPSFPKSRAMVLGLIHSGRLIVAATPTKMSWLLPAPS